MGNNKEKLKPLDQAMLSFCGKYGFDVSRIFDDFLRYIIHGYSIPGLPGLSDWKYTEEQNKGFLELYQNFVLNMQEKLKHREWYDILGETYEAIIAGKGRRSNSGQFFTPMSLCDLMTDIVYSEDDNRKVISDPTCGSGRTLLAYNAKNKGCYHIAEDIDRTCAMMTVVNFLIHGITGEVINHDALMQNETANCWLVNYGLNNYGSYLHGVINIRPVEWKDTRLSSINERSKKIVRIKKRLEISLRDAEKRKDKANNKAQYEIELNKIRNIKKVLKKYEA